MPQSSDSSRIIVTKVLVPRIRPGFVHRARLVNQLHDHIERKLILISAAPGCGKTSLLIDFAHNTDLPVCWYALDETDRDATTLFEYLIFAIGQRYPGFGRRATALLRGMRGAAPGVHAMVAVLVNEIQETIPEYFVLILDDYHLIEDSAPIQSFFDLFLRYLPENCHIILATRTVPNLPLVRLAAYQEVAGLGTDELSFNAEEIQALIQAQYSLNMPHDIAEEVARQSEGWITGILLTAQTFWRDMVENLTRARGSPEQIFEYLAREVFTLQPPRVRQFLLESSILRQMNPALCDELRESNDAGEIIDWIEQRNLFVVRLEGPGPWYKYSRLFQEFLQSRLRSEREADFAALHRRAALLLEGRKMHSDAIYHWFQAGEYVEACRLVESIAPALYEAGRLEILRGWIDTLPEQVVAHAPDLLVTRARIYIQRGEPQLARQALDQAAREFEASGQASGEATVLVYRSAIATREGKYQEAVEACRSALERLDRGDKQLTAAAHRNLGLGYWGLGQLDRAHDELVRALALYENLGSTYHVANVHQELGVCLRALGNTAGADLHYRKSLTLWEQIGNDEALAIVLNSMAVSRHHRGEYDEALHLFEEALARAREATGVRVEGYILAGMADVYRDLGDYADCQALYSAALDQANLSGDGFLTVYALDALGNTARLRGDYVAATGLLRQAMSEAEMHHSGRELGFVETSLGLLMTESGDVQDALACFERAVEHLAPTGARADLARVHFLQAQAHYRARQYRQATERLRAALDLVYQVGMDQFMVAGGKPAIPMLRYAERRLEDPRVGFLLTRIEAFTRMVATRQAAEVESRAAAEPPVHSLEIRALGPGKVIREGVQVTQPNWGAAQARELFFYLLDNPGRSKEQIGLVFWPELSSARMTSAFHATLYRVRRAIGRDCILYENERYAFNTRIDFWYDVSEFETLLEQAESPKPLTDEAAEQYQRAIGLYRGEFLEDSFSDWVSPRREAIRRLFLNATCRLAAFYVARGEHQKAIELSQKALEQDGFWEEAHRQLMRSYAGLGERAQALQHYDRLAFMLREELGTDPSRETTSLYMHIRQT